VATAKAKIIVERIQDAGRDGTTFFRDQISRGLNMGAFDLQGQLRHHLPSEDEDIESSAYLWMKSLGC
jgi:hypothetical protein